MRGDFDEDEYDHDDEYPYDEGCNMCMGAGFIVVCNLDDCGE